MHGQQAVQSDTMTLSASGCPTEQRLRVQAHGDGIDDWPPACALNPAPPNGPDAQIAQQQTPSAVAALFLFAQTIAKIVRLDSRRKLRSCTLTSRAHDST
jgi:hypothetical protein